jgi:ADP-ribosyl-[dinitrogen reductase] hydrolase
MNQVNREQYIGCLLGGAVGDALGWPVEFEALDTILELFGPSGVMEMVPGEGGFYEITDDTQMTLFTAEGLLRAWTSSRHEGRAPDFAATLKRSYLCWLATQGGHGRAPYSERENFGWLLAVKGLHQRRAPGNTCLSALRKMTLNGENIAANTSKGCGGVMRAAPAGLLAARISAGDSADAARLAFEIGCQSAALTHGHPSGHLPAGVLATIIAAVILGETIEKGIELSLDFLDGLTGASETVEALRAALRLFYNPLATPSPEVVESLGEGWDGDEALAIGLYCALAAGGDFARGVRLAVNHSGDSDSTGSITGNILGALLSEQAIPPPWLERLELADVIRQVGSDLYATFEDTAQWLKRYPPV